MLECLECNKLFSSPLKLSKHVKFNHCDQEEYYKKHYTVTSCKECSKPTNFIDMFKGYRNFCSKTCGCTFSRRLQRQNVEKETAFREKLSQKVKLEWATKDQTTRIKNASKTLRENNAKLTIQEKKQKFGWMNKLKDEELAKAKEKSSRSLKKFWKEADETTKQEIFEKRKITLNKTWNLHGKEILDKIMNTFLERRKDKQYLMNECEYNYEKLNKSLKKIFSI